VTNDHGPADDGIVRTPDDTHAGRRYRHRLMQPPDAPHGPNLIQLRVLASARLVELSEKRQRTEWPNRGSIERLRLRGRSLLERFRWECDVVNLPLDQLDPAEFANWTLSLKPEMARNSWTECRAAARTIIEALPHDRQPVALGMLDADTNDMDEEAHVRRGGADVKQRHGRIEMAVFDIHVLRQCRGWPTR
jgi:hypothetical protein